jgi:2-iminoacetate synthase
MIVDTQGLTSFIPEADIISCLEKARRPDPVRVRDILQKSLAKNRLDPEEMAVLLHAEDPALLEEIFAGARELKQRIYGNRIVLFAPLYIGNDCINDCQYCGFRRTNPEVARRTLSLRDLDREVEALVKRGHKRLILVYGEHPRYDADFIHDTVREVYAQKHGKGEIRRVNINAAPLDVAGFQRVKSAGIGTYQIFQETYHSATYRAMHPSGPKSNYLWRLHGLDRAQEAGIDDVGIGALIGLYDWRFEALGLLHHTIHLEERFRVGPHTISFPRIEPAIGTELCNHPPHRVSDAEFKRLVAILRLAVPYTGLILTCRESVALRNEILQFGVSQIDAGSNIGVGAYSQEDGESYRRSQFVLNDGRSLDQVIRELCEADFIPSFCTGCYRLGRTGEHFMEFAIPGFVKRFCTPNAVLTFLEYLEDYASPETRVAGLRMIERELERVPEGEPKTRLLERIGKVRDGARDLFF